jgi:hypothetical protein
LQEATVTQGIWQATDHRPVTAQEARREWALVAHDILEEVARRYGRSVAYADLAGEVQRRSGIATNLELSSWLDDIISEVDVRCNESGEPRLIALIDRPGVARTGEVPAARLACYEAYGAKIPTRKASRGAGRTRSATPAAPPTRKRAKVQERVRPICPRCFVELPATGICDNCD